MNRERFASLFVLSGLLLATPLLHAQNCAKDKATLAQLEKELQQDNNWLATNCANSLSAECQQQGPGMRQAVKLLNEEINALRQQIPFECGPPPTPKPTPTPALHVRQSIATLSPAQIASLRKGFQVMMGRAVTDPTSYRFQANIHGTYDTPTTPLETQAWNQCEHGSYYFFSWHRMYLYFFERILRKAAGDPNLSLPYWNWSDPAQRALPLPFRQPADSTNSLFIPFPGRQQAVDDGTGQLSNGVVDFSTAFNSTIFDSPAGNGFSFGGQTVSPKQFNFPHGELESQPHDIVHSTLGGLMGDPDTAGQDPIFWLHHANIDRLWKRWLDQGGGRGDPTSDANWMNTTFTFFDENGNAVQMSGSQIIKTVAQLDYKYDDDPNLSGGLQPASPLVMASVVEPRQAPALMTVSLTSSAAPRTSRDQTSAAPEQVKSRAAVVNPAVAAQNQRQALAVQATTAPSRLSEAPLTVSLPLSADTSNRLRELLARPAGHRIVLEVDDIRYEKPPGIYYEVYLNLPKGAEPDPRGPNFVGNLAFFALMPHPAHKPGESAQPQTGGRRDFDITKTVSTLMAKEAWTTAQATVTFVARGLVDREGKPLPISPGTKATIGRIAITTE